VLAFISCKGGSGATLSTNFGAAGRAGRQGAADRPARPVRRRHAVCFRPEAAMTLSDICAQISRMDGVPRFLPGARGLQLRRAGGGRRSHRTVDMKPEHMDTILRVARQHYDFVVLDVGRQIDAISLRALDQADTIYPCCNWRCPISAMAAACSIFSARSAIPTNARA
jgi:pilus assembly protein CpaE